MCPPTMAIAATDLALRDLSLDDWPSVSGSHHDGHLTPLRADVVELEHDAIGLAAVDAWMHREVHRHECACCLATTFGVSPYAGDLPFSVGCVIPGVRPSEAVAAPRLELRSIPPSAWERCGWPSLSATRAYEQLGRPDQPGRLSLARAQPCAPLVLVGTTAVLTTGPALAGVRANVELIERQDRSQLLHAREGCSIGSTSAPRLIPLAISNVHSNHHTNVGQAQARPSAGIATCAVGRHPDRSSNLVRDRPERAEACPRGSRRR